MKILVIGATGYVGSAVARAFSGRNHQVYGLARNANNAATLAKLGVQAVHGNVDDLAALSELAAPFEVVVMAAMVPFEAELPIMQALIDSRRTGLKHLIFTSGTGVLSIEAKDGAWNQNTFAEDDPFPFPARPNRAMRIKTETLVREAATADMRTCVIRPPLIYGNAGSIQIPQIFESTRKTGAACYLGYGLNLYSAVHVDDLAEAYCLAVEKGTPGALYHTVSGEANFRSIAEAIAQVVGCPTKSLDYGAACELWGPFWVDIALAVNSRSVARRAAEELGWRPRHIDVIEDIRNGSYREAYHAAGEAHAKEFAWTSHG